MKELRLTLPGMPPSVNHMYKSKWIKGRKFEVYTMEAEAYLLMSSSLARVITHRTGWIMTEEKKIIVDIWVYLPDKRKRDTHNMLKILLDALQGIVYDDDYFALPRIIDFEIDVKNPRIEIRIMEKHSDKAVLI